jgi:hypothetical protein
MFSGDLCIVPSLQAHKVKCPYGGTATEKIAAKRLHTPTNPRPLLCSAISSQKYFATNKMQRKVISDYLLTLLLLSSLPQPKSLQLARSRFGRD